MSFLFRFILFIFLFYLFARLIFRYVFPWLLKRWVKNMERKQQNGQSTYYRNNDKSKEGEIHIEKIPEQPAKSAQKNSDDEEYVDYEEL